MFPNDNVTCIGPWYEIRIDANGNMRGCHAFGQNYSEKSDLSFLEWFNKGNGITSVRNSIINGDGHPGCTACYKIEEQGIISFRQRRNIQAAVYSGKHFKESLQQSPALKRIIGNENIYPAFMHVTLSNLCNLSCRMCFPDYSTQLSSLYKKVGIIDNDKPILLDWTTDDNKWNEFLELVKNNPNLMSLHFMGGEPLYHRRFFEFIDWCIINNKTDFHLTFVTNGTTCDVELLTKLKKFKSIQLEVSIENLDETNNYVRINSDYNQVKQNILTMVEYLGNKSVVLRSVPQALTVIHYENLIDFAVGHNLAIDSNVLTSPEYLKCFVLPKELKIKIVDKLKTKYADILSFDGGKNFVSKFRVNDIRGFKYHIESIIIRLGEQEPDNIEDLRKQFVEYNNKLDSVTGQKFIDVYPELLNFYEKYSTI